MLLCGALINSKQYPRPKKYQNIQATDASNWGRRQVNVSTAWLSSRGDKPREFEI
jgi:hypothetical protein